MSSPNLNNIIILGCILCYASVVLLGLDARMLSKEQYASNCNVRYNTVLLVFRKRSMTIGQLKPESTWPIIETVRISDLTLGFE